MLNRKICIEEFNCSKDGQNIWGKQYFPEQKEGMILSAIIISHHLMLTSKDVEHYAETFANLGYAIFIFDFCGGSLDSKSEGFTTDMSVFTEADDLISVINYVRSIQSINLDDILLMGCSQGAFVSAIVAAKLKNLINGLIMFYPGLCIPDNCRNGNILGTHFNPNNIPEKLYIRNMKIGKIYAESVLKMDIVSYLSTYKGPVLITHGNNDNIVDINYSIEAKEYYDNCELIIIKNGRHGYSMEHDKIAINAVIQFLRKQKGTVGNLL